VRALRLVRGCLQCTLSTFCDGVLDYLVSAVRLEFIVLSVEVPGDAAGLHAEIATALDHHGDPLRWAIVAVQGTTAQVEAVVIKQAS